MRKTLILLLISFNLQANSGMYSKLIYPKVAESLSRLETGHFKSKLCSKYNNLFGMKVGTRKFHVGKTKAGYAIYPNKQASIADYAAYEKRMIKKHHISSQRQYILLISKRYGKDKKYAQKLNKQLKICG